MVYVTGVVLSFDECKCLFYGFNNKQLRLKLKDEPKTAKTAYELRKPLWSWKSILYDR